MSIITYEEYTLELLNFRLHYLYTFKTCKSGSIRYFGIILFGFLIGIYLINTCDA